MKDLAVSTHRICFQTGISAQAVAVLYQLNLCSIKGETAPWKNACPACVRLCAQSLILEMKALQPECHLIYLLLRELTEIRQCLPPKSWALKACAIIAQLTFKCVTVTINWKVWKATK